MKTRFLMVLGRRMEAAKREAWKRCAIHRAKRTPETLDAYVSALRRCYRLQDALNGSPNLSPDIFPDSLWRHIRAAAA